jgi:hypothetical protein
MMKWFHVRRLVGITVTGALTLAGGLAMGDDLNKENLFLDARIVAVGVPGISAITQVGTFLPGGPIHDNPQFAGYTMPGRVLDPQRLLVGSTSNFGEPLANTNQLPGSFLSIDPRSDGAVVPPDFAEMGGQAVTLGGLVQMYSAQSFAFLNSIHNPLAATADFTGVSNPLGISINNAFGRLWPVNAPYGLDGIGSSTILDPPGEPLDGAPNPTVGGVYASNLTPRMPTQIIPGGLFTGAVGTAFLGASPDGSNKAVFAVVCADGSIVQENTAKALDGLAPAGTVSPLIGRRWSGDDEDDRGASPRVGVLLNFSPSLILYASEAFENSIAAIDLTNDGTVFHIGNVRRIKSPVLDNPVDLAPVKIASTSPAWAANTTLDKQADLYVANRGNNTIVRMRQDGTVVAVRRIRLSDGRGLGDLRLNGIATSSDGSKVWVTMTGHLPGFGQLSGAVLELSAF